MTELSKIAKKIRVQLIQMHYKANSGHISSGLSCVEILAYLHKEWLTPNDCFILSKGHGASALYATLWAIGVLTDKDLATYYQDGTLLSAHPAPLAFSAIPFATGSLGHGLPIATGIAYANQIFHENGNRTACLVSDGECNEGSTWEAALFAGHHKLENLTVIIDSNGLQGFGSTKDVLNTEPLVKKWEAFGFAVQELDGHDFSQLNSAFKSQIPGKPSCLIARTHKGKGVSFMQDQMSWHYLPLTKELYEKAMSELESQS